MSYIVLSSPDSTAKFTRKPEGGESNTIAGVAVAPSKHGGFDVCPYSGSCARFCLGTETGRNRMDGVRKAQLRRKKLLVESPEAFRTALLHDMDRFVNWAAKKKLDPYVRPHMYSDNPVDEHPTDPVQSVLNYSWLAREYSASDFYGYTKHPRAYAWDWPSNYWITYSWSEKSKTQTAQAYLRRGFNVAMVFGGELPDRYKIGSQSYQVVDGDLHDYRVPKYDGYSNIIGLRFKGSAANRVRSIRSGFTKEVVA